MADRFAAEYSTAGPCDPKTGKASWHHLVYDAYVESMALARDLRLVAPAHRNTGDPAAVRKQTSRDR
jgi:hypothetical protein